MRHRHVDGRMRAANHQPGQADVLLEVHGVARELMPPALVALPVETNHSLG
jgi:hypothetical protein